MSERSIFIAALEKDDPAERAAYLDRACDGNPPLRQRIERLLTAHEQNGSFLQAPAAGLPGTVDEPPIAERAGSIIGPYKLLQQIGEGGMGVVYMAEQEQPVRRRVALKIIKPGMDSAQVIARFEAERQALAIMDHQNIAKVFDAGTTGTGRPYFVMELVHGVPLTKYCDENQLTPRQRLELFVPACQAIQHAHQKGIIHRDIKPSNVLVTLYDGKPVPKVIDFGVAKATEQRLTERTLFTQYGMIVGTFEYMAPEQAEMSALGVDTRSDIYSLGVLLYELLTGTTPLEGERLREAAFAEMVRMIKEEEPPRPSLRLSSSGAALATISQQRGTEPTKLAKLVAGELDWIVMKCLEKDRTRRYETASGLARDVQRHLADEPVEACPPSAGYKLRKLARKYRTPLRVAGAFLLLLVLGVVVSIWQAVRATLAERDATEQRDAAAVAEKETAQQRDEAQDANARLQAAQEELRRTLYASDMNVAQAAWESDNVNRTLELLERHRPRAGEPDLRGFEWHYWRRVCQPELRTLKLGSVGWLAVLNRDGTRAATLAVNERRPTAKVWDVATGKELLSFQLTAGPGGGTGWVFSPDGKRLAVARGVVPQPAKGELRVFDADTGKELLGLEGRFTIASVPAFSPDGSLIAMVVRDWQAQPNESKLKVWDVATGHEVLSISAPSGFFTGAAFSPDGTRVVTRFRDPEQQPAENAVWIWDVASRRKVLTLKGHSGSVNSGVFTSPLAFSPDGKRITSGSGGPGLPSELIVWDAATGKELLTILQPPGSTRRLAFSPDGTRIAASSSSPVMGVWDAVTGKAQLTLKGHTGVVSDLTFSADGKRLYSAGWDGTVKEWDATASNEPTTPKGLLGTVSYASFSRDGTLIAGVTEGSTPGRADAARVWDVATGKEVVCFKGHAGARAPIVGASFSPDGKRVATISGAWDTQRQGYVSGELKLWHAATGKELLSIPASPGPGGNRVAFSPDGTRMALITFAGDGEKEPHELKVWDAATGKELLTIPGVSRPMSTMPLFSSVAFSPDGRRIAAPAPVGQGETERSKVKVWDAASGRELLALEGHLGRVISVAFSPDGRRLASGDVSPGRLGEVKVWDAATGQKLLSLKVRGIAAHDLAFSPDGRRLAATMAFQAAAVGEVKLWDVATGQELLTLKRQNGSVQTVVFSPDGNRIFAAGSFYDRRGQVMQVWDATPLPEKRTPEGNAANP